jgi:hypothetical protein
VKNRPERAPAPPSPYLDAREASIYLRLAPRTLEDWRWSGKGGPPFRRHGDRVVYYIPDLDEWSARQKRLSTSDVQAQEDVSPKP